MFMLRFSGGRHHPDERLQDWGFDGPCVGPLSAVHVDQAGLVAQGPDGLRCDLPMIGGLVFYGGLFFSEVEVLQASEAELALESRLEPLDPGDAAVPRWAWKGQRDVGPVKLRRADLPAFRDAVEVFCDRVAEIAGDGPARAARHALSRVVTDYLGRRPVAHDAIDPRRPW